MGSMRSENSAWFNRPGDGLGLLHYCMQCSGGYGPIKNWVNDSLYVTHCSVPMADFRAAYIGSRSIRAGII